MMLPKLKYIAIFVSGAVCAAESVIDPYGPSQSDFGGVGLLQMPTARMAKTGEFSANYIDNDQYRRWSISAQPFDWFEATLRYTDVRTKKYSPYEDFSGDQTYKDKGMDFKFRLWQESNYLPQVSVGFRDLMGTGLFDSEFVTASKRYGPFDFTIGIGWGNMAESGNIKNPFCEYKDRWCQRNNSYSGNGGKFEVDSLFHGPAALFGGVEYQTPWQPLRLKLEYDGNDYSKEFAGHISQDSPWNVGAVYRVFDNLDSHLSWQRGNTLMWGVTFRTNFNDMKPAHIDQPRPIYQPDQIPATMTDVKWQALTADLKENAGWQDTEFYTTTNSVTVIGTQSKYRDENEAMKRASLLAANYLPGTVDELNVVERKSNFHLQETRIDLPSVRRANVVQVLGEEQHEKSTVQAAGKIQGNSIYASERKVFSYSFDPDLTQSFGGAESFYMYQLGINANADWRINEKNSLQGTLFVNLVNNYDEFNYKAPPPDGAALPRVRTWIREYVDSSDVLLNNLQLTHMQPLAQDWYGQAYGGYLEMMYAGVGSEVLYRPYGKTWAIGVDANWVKQRDWNNTLKMADYDVMTGHVTAYWQLPFMSNVTAKVSVGQYLAGDKGATFDFSKRFDSGVVLGGYATFTNVSADEYGEGSFTKGIYVTIPFDLMLLKPTTAKGSIGWVPLTRDGGQMLSRKNGLYGLTELQ
ncbi:YjbH domain-containing protein [Aeromonas veronii]|uniref:YjbH domain-containing protein n=1 Tax=Aeromonas veronii TaxID=654 RepID=UPI00187E8E11|nr:YjbH domain-containing protein [Aeromonas veronii]MBE8735422.1 YjbH domain-containing protein [Aeromonas veronii]MBE8740084.1 YjbH domain-containing protein [Aeromonas veronii]MBE8742846.1 YjbH domain-containing protein [Aeromonas veronii]MBE8762773.1 YjbH domain-containing protein [Aeromonas veronii]MBE8838395.1 YjbH domain-containing protein [Aeromonas veronii]